ncbi:MAG: hypothetical protein JNL05_00245 [Flavobacteriales bacterium]|nr:hypothetical protein [Flavobacteriales bacterium]
MDRSLFTALALCTVLSLVAQAPQRMSYQAVVRDANDALVTSAPVGLRLSVNQGSLQGTAVYVETHTATTNTNGLATLEVGGGTVVSGSFSAIDWSAGPYFLRTEADPQGGTNYTIDGGGQLLSVPYALHAANSGVGPQGPAGPPGAQGPPGQPACATIRAGNAIVVYTGTNAYGFYQSESMGGLNNAQWTSTSLSGTVLGAIASENTIVIYTTTNAYCFYQSESSGNLLNNAQWTSTSLSGNVLGAEANKNLIVVYTSSNGYAAYQSQSSGNLNLAQWTSTSFSGNVLGAAASRHQIVVYTDTNAYGAYQSQSLGGFNSAQWTSTSLSGPPLDLIPLR